MNASTNHHLTQLDRTLVMLLNERARLIARATPGEGISRGSFPLEAHLQDLLRRSDGPFPAGALREAFRTIHAGCEGVAR